MPLFDNVKAVLRPPTVVIHRNEPVHDPESFPQVSQRYEVQVRTQPAPMPVPDSAFASVGRGPESQNPHQWRYTSLAIPEILSVMGWPFMVPKVPSALVVNMPRGNFLPTRTRVNIDAPQPTSLGTLTAVGTEPMWLPSLSKLT